MPLWIIGTIGATLFGLVCGSFATVLVHRIPREIPLGLTSHRRSRCPRCNAVIPWYNNIPLLSYLLLKGRCPACKKKISRRYPLIELMTALLFGLTFAVQMHAVDRPVETAAQSAEMIKVLYFTLALIATTFIDLEFRIIPDRFSLGGWIIALGASVLWGTPDIFAALVGGLFGAGVFFALAWVYEKWKGIEGLGLGDVKMMGWLGSWIGFWGVPFVILFASISGLAVGLISMRKSKDGLKTAIPFGPFLAGGAYVAWVLMTLGLW